MRVKICGVTTANDARFIENAGADAVGVVISPESKRNVSIAQAKEIFDALGPFIIKVVVTHTNSAGELEEIISLKPDAIQISTDLKIPDNFTGRVIRVIKSPENIPNDCDAVIYDESCGENKPYNQSYAKEIVKKSTVPVILAGGLNSSNVSFAIDSVKPYAVDVCTGVEERPGVKNRFEVLEFLRACGKIPGVRLKENCFGN